ncbi:HPr family phosphocarrier protein [Alkaliphilus hydrothermalis]|uniref:Phosphocarrier protein HPr n=1 Tax=Alkaliphilus hydrothermalis TaxID=1482730 RepID=A0ABS2NN87_9FIRM|nr:HPr family phosphocarrier protein [Alkaliphilus hydrothermalis]MBM7614395.1 phosphocarrier protein [Alkaliphilus hydrothermalis]
MIKQTVVVNNGSGLHARPATLVVKEASKFESDVTFISGTAEVNAKSIMGIMALGAKQGQSINVKVEGNDEEEAMKAIIALFQSNFGEA